MLHRLCGPPSIPLSFSLATVLPRRGAKCVSDGTAGVNTATPSTQRLRRGLPGYLILFVPHAFASQRQYRPESRLRRWCSSRYLRISPLHREFRSPLRDSSEAVSNAVPGLGPGLSHPTYQAPTRALRPIIPNNARTLRLTAAAGTELAGASFGGTVSPPGY